MFISVFSACLLPAQAQTPAPTSTPSALTKQATAIVRNMSPQQKIGQLFMISFPGSDAFVMSDVADLITNYRVGGVFLRAANQNFIIKSFKNTKCVAILCFRIKVAD